MAGSSGSGVCPLGGGGLEGAALSRAVSGRISAVKRLNRRLVLAANAKAAAGGPGSQHRLGSWSEALRVCLEAQWRDSAEKENGALARRGCHWALAAPPSERAQRARLQSLSTGGFHSKKTPSQ